MIDSQPFSKNNFLIPTLCLLSPRSRCVQHVTDPLVGEMILYSCLSLPQCGYILQHRLRFMHSLFLYRMVVSATLLPLLFLCVVSLRSAPIVVGEEWNPEWNVISGDRKTVSSTCIGTNATPQCLADSAVACGAWSTPIKFSVSGRYEDDPICGRTPGLERGGVAGLTFALPVLMEHHYLVDFWVLTETEMIESPIMEYPEPWQAGDLVADFYAVSCAPEKSCMSAVASTDPSEILARCPRTHCSGTPFISRDLDGDGSLLFWPWETLILRQSPEGWRVVARYNLANGKMHHDPAWVPKRWKRQE